MLLSVRTDVKMLYDLVTLVAKVVLDLAARPMPKAFGHNADAVTKPPEEHVAYVAVPFAALPVNAELERRRVLELQEASRGTQYLFRFTLVCH
jgi:hypothetical protein